MKKLFAPYALPMPVDLAFLIIRIVAGVAMMMHGLGKIQSPFNWMGPEAPVPGVFQFLAAISEFGGGLAWVLGLLTRLGSLGVLITMAVAVSVHVSKGDPFVASGAGGGSYEPAATYFVLALLFVLAGPGRYSLDYKIFGTKSDSAN